MKNLIASIGFILLTATAQNAEAGEYWDVCNSCSSTEQKWAAERISPNYRRGSNTVYIMDIDSKTINKYKVTSRYHDREGVTIETVTSLSIDSQLELDYKSYVNELEQQKLDLVGNGIELPSSLGINSAFDIIHNSGFRNSISTHVSTHIGFIDVKVAGLVLPLTAIDKIASVVFIVPVTFPDGSTANWVLTGSSLTGTFTGEYEYTYVEGSAKDRQGNNIPENTDDAVGTATYDNYESSAENTADMLRMDDFINQWYGNSGGGTITCTWKFSDGTATITCKLS
ncbi:MAG: hypothetical protein ABJI60_01075 [Kangiellaceae bacterium]